MVRKSPARRDTAVKTGVHGPCPPLLPREMGCRDFLQMVGQIEAFGCIWASWRISQQSDTRDLGMLWLLGCIFLWFFHPLFPQEFAISGLLCKGSVLWLLPSPRKTLCSKSQNTKWENMLVLPLVMGLGSSRSCPLKWLSHPCRYSKKDHLEIPLDPCGFFRV